MKIQVDTIENIVPVSNRKMELEVTNLNPNIISEFSVEDIIMNCDSISELIKGIMSTDEYKEIVVEYHGVNPTEVVIESTEIEKKGMNKFLDSLSNNDEFKYVTDKNGVVNWVYEKKEEEGDSVETTQPEWMNPESDKYYKGYRYHKDEEGDNWYNENDELMREICFNRNGFKTYEAYYNELYELHNEDGPAYIQYYHEDKDFAEKGIVSWKEIGDVIKEKYYLNGNELTEDQWKQEVNKLKLINKYPISFESFQDYEMITDEKTGDELWVDNKDNVRVRVGYFDNGNIEFIGVYNEEGEFHNEYDVAWKCFNKEGKILRNDYFLNGKEVSGNEIVK